MGGAFDTYSGEEIYIYIYRDLESRSEGKKSSGKN